VGHPDPRGRRRTVTAGTAAVAFGLGDRVFGTEATSFAVMTTLLPLASVTMGINRGVLAGRGSYGGTALAIVGENLIRVALVLLVGGEWGATGLGWILMAGFVVAAAFPGSFRRRSRDVGVPEPLTLLGGFAGSNATAQTVLTVSPVVLSLLGGADRAVTEMFSVLAILRAPYLLMLGVSARITGPLTRMASGSDRTPLRRLQVWLGLAAIAGAVLAVPVSLLVPPLTRIAFGLELALSATTVALLTVGCTVGLVSLVQMLVLLADGRARALAGAWATAIAVGLVVLLATQMAPAGRVAVAFVTAETVALASMLVPALRAPRQVHAPTV
jgi:hypothetical protein